MIALLILVSGNRGLWAIDLQTANAVSINAAILFKPLLSALIYLWVKDNSSSKVNLFGLINVPARGKVREVQGSHRVYPLVLIGLDVVQTGSVQGAIPSIMGVIVGHLW